MIILFFIASIITSAASEQESAGLNNVGADTKNNRGLSNAYESLIKSEHHNSTYVEIEDNMLRIPSKYYEDSKTKKKFKKSPKRTVQKIIKKNKVKTRRLYLFPATMLPTLPSRPSIKNNLNTNPLVTTTENSIKKKPRKNQRYNRYPMPFQKLQRKDGTHRFRREEGNVYILNQFDEMKFLSKEKDHDKVLTHIQRHW